MKTSFLQIAILNFFWILWPFTFLFKRKQNIWVFGSYKNTYADNSKYLFEFVAKNKPEVRAIWISGDNNLVKSLIQEGYEAHWRYSLKAILLSLKASTFIFNSFISDVIMWTSRGALKINLWHGVPMKKIEHDIDSGTLKPIYQPKGIIENITARLKAPYVYDKTINILATSEEVRTLFSKAFRIRREQTFIAGYPRLAPFWDDSLQMSDSWVGFKDVLIYMPTFRDNSSNFLQQAFPEPQKLNALCQELNTLIAFKLHPNTAQKELEPFMGLSNIQLIENNKDVYPMLKFTSGLITDYSSIYNDYSALHKPILFYAPDLKEYNKNSRGTYFEYNEITFNQSIETYSDFEKALSDLRSYAVDGKRIADRFWTGDTKNGNEEVYSIIKDKLVKRFS